MTVASVHAAMRCRTSGAIGSPRGDQRHQDPVDVLASHLLDELPPVHCERPAHAFRTRHGGAPNDWRAPSRRLTRAFRTRRGGAPNARVGPCECPGRALRMPGSGLANASVGTCERLGRDLRTPRPHLPRARTAPSQGSAWRCPSACDISLARMPPSCRNRPESPNDTAVSRSTAEAVTHGRGRTCASRCSEHSGIAPSVSVCCASLS
jgi:hypothetical protein